MSKKSTKERKISRKAIAIKFASPKKILDYRTDFLKSLSNTEYKIYLNRLANIANARAKRTLKYTKDSYAVNEYYIKGGKFGNIGNGTRTDLIKEVNRTWGFLRNKSSTIEGMEEIKRKGEDTIYRNTGLRVNLSGNAGDYFYRIYNKVRDSLSEEIFYEFYEEIATYANFMSEQAVAGSATIDHILEMAEEYAHSLYIRYMNDHSRGETQEEKEIWNEVDEELANRKKYGY